VDAVERIPGLSHAVSHLLAFAATTTTTSTNINKNNNLLARHSLQPSWQRLARWSSMLESYIPINRDALQFE